MGAPLGTGRTARAHAAPIQRPSSAALRARTLACLLRSALEKIQPRVVSFEDSVTVIREGLAEVLEQQEDYAKAATVLAGIDLDSGEGGQATAGWGPAHVLAWRSQPPGRINGGGGEPLQAWRSQPPGRINGGGAGVCGRAGMRIIDPAYKLQTNVKIAMLYLEDDDPVNAEHYIKKASALIAQGKVRPSSPRTE